VLQAGGCYWPPERLWPAVPVATAWRAAAMAREVATRRALAAGVAEQAPSGARATVFEMGPLAPVQITE
jgi:hypothetical protein